MALQDLTPEVTNNGDFAVPGYTGGEVNIFDGFLIGCECSVVDLGIRGEGGGLASGIRGILAAKVTEGDGMSWDCHTGSSVYASLFFSDSVEVNGSILGSR